MVVTLAALVALTFASEDLACVAAGALIAHGELSAAGGILACALGIYLGDLGLWAIGRLGGRLARSSSWLARRVPSARVDRCRSWLDRHAGGAIIASRFVPGTRLPLYVTAGLVRMSPWRFAAWTFAAVVLWTPAVVLASAGVGRTVAPSTGWSAVTVAVVTLVIFRRAVTTGPRNAAASAPAFASAARRRLRWEFWPPWLFYAPVAAYVLLLAIRHRSLTVLTASNPGMPDGGFVGESKFHILQRLPRQWTIPSARVRLASTTRAIDAMEAMRRHGWTFPLVLKPDVGQRGVGVQLVRSHRELHEYLRHARGDVLLQPYHEGPYEAGVFYYRRPGDARGRIFSITDKRFPVVIGDGRRTLAQLIDAHPRYRLQDRLFLRRHERDAQRVLASGERLSLTIAGNHAQGTTFYDGAHLWTPALEARIDAISRQYPGFFIGRYDIRYGDVEAFKAGEDLAIVELNGATAESTNIYDPGASLLSAYRTLFRQWSLVFGIGAANVARGAKPTPFARLLRLAYAHLTPVRRT